MLWVVALLFTSGALLFYTATVAPVQIFLWDYGDQCNIFPSLYFDVLVDIFFLVRPSREKCSIFELQVPVISYVLKFSARINPPG